MNAPVEQVDPARNDVERIVNAAHDALTDEMVTRLAGMWGETVTMIDQANRAGIGRALPAIARLVENGDLERIIQLARLMSSAQDALTDEMVTRLAGMWSETVTMIDQANRAGLARALPAIARLVENGDLDRISQLARVYSSAQDALTDEMVGRMAETIGNGLLLLDRVNRGGAESVVGMLESLNASGALERLSATLPQLLERLTMVQQLLQAVDDASAASRAAQASPGGLGGLWHLMRDPEAQDTLRFLLDVGKKLRQGALIAK